jgi:hypothetical protein
VEKKGKHHNFLGETFEHEEAVNALSRARLMSRLIGAGLLCFVAFFCLHGSKQAFRLHGSQGYPARAAIVDHLSISWPNPAFVKECTAILKRAGYEVDYYKGEQVTVELYRDLPTHGYKLIVLRAHSAYIHKYLSLAMFTSEPYSKQRYVYEQLRNRVASGYIHPYREGDPRYLVITDKFVRFSMKGSFNDTVIVMMGCAGIKKCAATAFLQKGAKVYLGWDGPVSARHTDRATIRFLEHFLNRGQTVASAVEETMKDVGYEPPYKSILLFWPVEAGAYGIKNSNDSIERVGRRSS